MKFGVIIFPGSNCDHDAYWTIRHVCKEPATFLWHESHDLENCDAVIVPGGFAYGDYLRTGAIAKFSPVMSAVAKVAAQGRPVLGICNGFQVLAEAGLVPGALQKNRGLTFLSHDVELSVVSTRSVLTGAASVGQRLRVPINHFSGSYVCDDDTYTALVRKDQIVLRYLANPNGSRDDIAAVSNEAGNVVGIMPHPERAVSSLTGSEDGKVLLSGFVAAAVGVS